jgi:hypothetical protein
MRTSMAYFAGVGTVVVAIGAGLGGGLWIANIVSPQSSKEMTKLERRMASQPIPAANAPAEPVPYLAPTQPPQTLQIEAANPAPAAAQPTAATGTAAKPPEAPASQPPAPAAQAATGEQTAEPENAFAKARDAELKRAAAKRKVDRHQQQWTDRRRYPQRRDQEPQDVGQNAREETEPREFIEQPVTIEFPRIRLFGQDEEGER